MEAMREGSVIFPRASRAQLVDNLSTTLNRKQSIMINIAQDNDTTPVELDKLFTQEEQKALEERGFLGTPKPTVEEWVASVQPEPKPAPDPMTTLMANLEAFIDKRVEEKVAAIMQSHATIALISQEQRNMMEELVNDAMDVHLSDIDHDEFCTKEQAEEIIGDIDMESAVKRAISHSNIVEDIVETAIDDIDWEEKVREGLVNILG
jgi:hypothetical protein